MALNVGLYGRGVRRWTMTERGRAAVSRSVDHLALGPSNLSWNGSELLIEISEWAVPVPRRVAGTIRISVPHTTPEAYQLDTGGRHFWHPIAPAARAEVSFQNPAMQWSGEAYLDSNWGKEPLEHGFRSWNWSRAALPDGAGIFYDATTRSGESRELALRFDDRGGSARFDLPPPSPLAPGPIWRVPRSIPAASGARPQTIVMLEDTPFYTRSRVATEFDGEPVTAIHESLDLDRFSSTWVRCLLPFRMPRRGG